MSHERPDGERFEFAERSKIMIGRTPTQGHGNALGKLWWRVTIYAGDSREDIDSALEEALRIDSALAKVGR